MAKSPPVTPLGDTWYVGLKANRVSGVGISEYLVVQRKDISDDSHTSVPDWLRVSLSHSFLVLLLVSAQIQPGKAPNLHFCFKFLARSIRALQIASYFKFYKARRCIVSLAPPAPATPAPPPSSASFHRCIVLLTAFAPAMLWSYNRPWAPFALAILRFRPQHSECPSHTPPSTMRLKLALRFCAREAPRDQPENLLHGETDGSS